MPMFNVIVLNKHNLQEFQIFTISFRSTLSNPNNVLDVDRTSKQT